MFLSKKSSILAALCLLALSTKGQNSLAEITVTTTKLPQKESQLAKSAIILTDSILNAHAGWSVSDLLQKQVGISIVGASQSLGSIQSVFMRGGNSGHTLLLLDGVPLYDPSSTEGNFDINLINLSDIERIEVLKGGQSTLYGSDALAGVINFITKKAGKEKFKPSVRIAYGSFSTLDAGLSLKGNIEGFTYNASFNNISSEGISSVLSEANEPENDGFNKTNYQLQLSKAFGHLNIRAYGRKTDYTADIDAGAFIDDYDFTLASGNTQFGAGVNYIKNKVAVNLNLNASTVERTFEDDSTHVPEASFNKYSISTFESKANFLEGYASYALSDYSSLLLGLDYRKQSIAQTYFSVGAFGPFEGTPVKHEDANTKNISLYSTVLLANDKLGLELGGRLNSHSEYGANFSYTLNPYVNITEDLSLYGLYATSFKNPSLYQLYSIYGNIDLTPEKSDNIEIGAKWNHKSAGLKAGLSWFNRNHEDKIGFLSSDAPPYGQYSNIDWEKVQGLEISLNKSFKNFTLNLNETVLDGSFGSIEGEEFELIRKPKSQLNVGATLHPSVKWNVSLNYQHLTKRNDRFYNNDTFSTEMVDLKAYGLVDVDFNYKLKSSLKAFASVSNVLNKTYTEVYGYRSRPINFRVGISWN